MNRTIVAVVLGLVTALQAGLPDLTDAQVFDEFSPDDRNFGAFLDGRVGAVDRLISNNTNVDMIDEYVTPLLVTFTTPSIAFHSTQRVSEHHVLRTLASTIQAEYTLEASHATGRASIVVVQDESAELSIPGQFTIGLGGGAPIAILKDVIFFTNAGAAPTTIASVPFLVQRLEVSDGVVLDGGVHSDDGSCSVRLGPVFGNVSPLSNLFILGCVSGVSSHTLQFTGDHATYVAQVFTTLSPLIRGLGRHEHTTLTALSFGLLPPGVTFRSASGVFPGCDWPRPPSRCTNGDQQGVRLPVMLRSGSGEPFANGLALTPILAAHQNTCVGKVVEVIGEATLRHPDGTTEPIAVNTPVGLHDVVETGNAGAVNIQFDDDTTFAISESARLSVDQFSFDPAETRSKSTMFGLLQGFFIYVSGLIGNHDPDVHIEMPIGCICIRGDASQYISKDYLDVAVRMNVGSPVSLVAPVPAARTDGQMSFEFVFLTPTGRLDVFVDDELLYSAVPADHPANVLQRVTIALAARSAMLGDTAKLTFRLDGPSGASLLLDNIVFPGLENGDFSQFDNGWFKAGPGRLELVATIRDARYAELLQIIGSKTVTALSPATLWVGLKNSDDVGLRLDLRAEVFVGGNKIGEGQLNNVSSGSSGFNNAQRQVIPLTLTNGAVTISPDSQLQVVVAARRTCFGGGHASGVPRLWFNGKAIDSGAGRDAGSRFAASIDGVGTGYFLRGSSALNAVAGSARISIDTSVKSTVSCSALGGRPFTSFATWSITPP